MYYVFCSVFLFQYNNKLYSKIVNDQFYKKIDV